MISRLSSNVVLSGLLVMLAFGFSACTAKKGPVGSENNPVKLYFVPSVDAKVIEDNSKIFKDYLEKTTGYKFEVSSPQSYIAVVEAFGTDRADIAALNTFGYVLAHEKYGAEAKLIVIRHGSATYQAQFIAKEGGNIKSVADFAGKKVAFVDPASTSGYLLPLKVLKDKNIQPSETVFAGKHDNVVSMVYQGQADGGATFYSPPAEGEIQDARRLVKAQYPDVEKRVKIVDLTDPIPNDPIVFRKGLPDDVKKKVADAFVSFVGTPEGKDAFKKIYGVDAIKVSSDEEFEPVRKMLKALGQNASDLMMKK